MEILSIILGSLAMVVLVLGLLPVLVGQQLMDKYDPRDGFLGKMSRWLMPMGLVLIVILMPILLLLSVVLFFVAVV